jgi:hypothetical protein
MLVTVFGRQWKLPHDTVGHRIGHIQSLILDLIIKGDAFS